MTLGWSPMARTHITIDVKISNINHSVLCTHNNYFLDNSLSQYQTFCDFTIFCISFLGGYQITVTLLDLCKYCVILYMLYFLLQNVNFRRKSNLAIVAITIKQSMKVSAMCTEGILEKYLLLRTNKY